MKHTPSYRYCIKCGGLFHPRREGQYVRWVCTRCSYTFYGNPHPTVGLLLVFRTELLFVRRAAPPFQGWWDLPGGFVERGESFEAGLKREIYEELGIAVPRCSYFGSFADLYQGEATLAVLFLSRIMRKPSVKPADDIQEAQWFPVHAPPQRLAFTNNRMAVRMLRKVV